MKTKLDVPADDPLDAQPHYKLSDDLPTDDTDHGHSETPAARSVRAFSTPTQNIFESSSLETNSCHASSMRIFENLLTDTALSSSAHNISLGAPTPPSIPPKKRFVKKIQSASEMSSSGLSDDSTADNERSRLFPSEVLIILFRSELLYGSLCHSLTHH